MAQPAETTAAPLLSLLKKAGIGIHWLLLSGLFGFFALKAFLQFKPSYDFVWYHLPRALRYFGLTSFTPSPALLERYKGFPPLAEYLQGFLVWSSGRLSAGNAIGFLGLVMALTGIFVIYRTSFSFRWFLTCLLAVPLFVFHLTIGYIDLFTAAMLLLGFAGLCGLSLNQRPILSALVMAIGLGCAMFSKFQAWPPAIILGLGGTFLLCSTCMKRQIPRASAIIALLLLWGAISFVPLRNYMTLGNPTYPVRVELPFLRSLPATEGTAGVGNLPSYLHKRSPVIRFIYSVFEINRLSSDRPYQWTFDQRDGDNGDHQRMGGWFFLTSLIMSLLLLIGFLKKIFPPVLFFAHVLSICVIAIVPQFHELRYSLFIPLNSLFLFCLFLKNYPPLLRTMGLLSLTACALFVLFQIRSTIFSLDLRPPQEFAPPEARAFWKAQTPASSQRLHIIPDKRSLSIFWSGPTFSEFPVQVK